jgi:hypothetical protein
MELNRVRLPKHITLLTKIHPKTINSKSKQTEGKKKNIKRKGQLMDYYCITSKIK